MQYVHTWIGAIREKGVNMGMIIVTAKSIIMMTIVGVGQRIAEG